MMILLQLAKRRPCYTTILPFFTAAQHNRRCYSSPPTPNPNPNFSAVDYFISSFGFSPDKAAKVSKPISHLKSPEKPDAVLRFLTHHGFSEADIKSLVTWQPTILCTTPENTLEPNLCALRHMGLSGPAITKIVLSGPSSLRCNPSITMPRIKFWMDFLGGDEAALVKVFTNNIGLISYDISRMIAPRISLLQNYGISKQDIRKIVLRASRFITSRDCVIEDRLKRAKELGFQPGSGMFVLGLELVARATKEALQKKMDLLKSFGWSEYELFNALRKAPGMGELTEENLRVKMNFLLGEARCDISYIASNPLLLKYSLAKRMRPRLRVLQLLESKGLSVPGQGFYTAMTITNTEFVERYILPRKDEIPELCDICLV